MRKALVTGGSGFVGGHLVRALLAHGCEVHVLLRGRLGMLEGLEKRLCIHQQDGSTEAVITSMQHAMPDVVFHLASRFVAEHRSEDVVPLAQSNVVFPAQLLEAMARTGVRHLVNTGTSWQHHGPDGREPVCLYAASKTAFEALLSYYVIAEDLRTVTLKLFDTYGPDDRRGKLFAALARAAGSREPVPMSAGAQKLDLVHVDDVVQAFIRAAERLLAGVGTASESYVVSSGSALPLRDVVAAYERVKNVRLNIAWGARPYRRREVMEPWRGGAALPGWRPRITLEQGLAQLPDPTTAA